MTQGELAKAVGYSDASAISMIERAQTVPSQRRVEQLETVLGLNSGRLEEQAARCRKPKGRRVAKSVLRLKTTSQDPMEVVQAPPPIPATSPMGDAHDALEGICRIFLESGMLPLVFIEQMKISIEATSMEESKHASSDSLAGLIADLSSQLAEAGVDGMVVAVTFDTFRVEFRR